LKKLANKSLIVILTPAFYAAYPDDVAHFDDILDVRLKRGRAEFVAFRDEVQRVVPQAEGAIVETVAETIGEIEDAISVESIALIVLAVAASLAGIVAVGQALIRPVAASRAGFPPRLVETTAGGISSAGIAASLDRFFA
jgi:hypothetical protein